MLNEPLLTRVKKLESLITEAVGVCNDLITKTDVYLGVNEAYRRHDAWKKKVHAMNIETNDYRELSRRIYDELIACHKSLDSEALSRKISAADIEDAIIIATDDPEEAWRIT